MTKTTAPLVPGEIRTHRAADGTVITAQLRPTGGILIQVRDTDGNLCPTRSEFIAAETTALFAYRALVAQHPAGAVVIPLRQPTRHAHAA